MDIYRISVIVSESTFAVKVFEYPGSTSGVDSSGVEKVIVGMGSVDISKLGSVEIFGDEYGVTVMSYVDDRGKIDDQVEYLIQVIRDMDNNRFSESLKKDYVYSYSVVD